MGVEKEWLNGGFLSPYLDVQNEKGQGNGDLNNKTNDSL